MTKLLTPIDLGALALAHRVVVLANPQGHRSETGAASRLGATGGLVLLSFAGDPEPTWRTDVKSWRRAHDRAHARRVISVACVQSSAIGGRPGSSASGAEEIGAAALAAGFDGVELDAANAVAANDGAGTSSAALLEMAQAMIEILGADRVGVRLAPFAWMEDRDDRSAARPLVNLLCALAGMEVAWVHVAGTFSRTRGDFAASPVGQELRAAFRGPLIASGCYSPLAAIDVVERRWADAVGFALIVGTGDSLVRSVSAAAR